jgi:hypothetical protein
MTAALLERPAPVAPSPPQLMEILPDRRMRLNFHRGQRRAWRSEKRFVAVLAGTQSGKTSWGPHWLYREIKRCGPGDYLVVTPTYKLLQLKALPELLRLFETLLKLGTYVASEHRFVFSEDGALKTFGEYDPLRPTQILFGHAQDPDSLESATAKAAWLDEAGQNKFKLGSWEAILRRLSLAMGRVLLTTTPYNLGWLKQRLFDPWQKARREGSEHPEIDVVRFDSTENPNFPQAEFERARRELPTWRFDLFYRAIFTRPAGMIYDCVDEDRHFCKRFPIPDEWPRYLGLDFGPVHMAAVFLAAKPNTRKLYAYRDYLAGGITTKQHVAAFRTGEPLDPTTDKPRLPRAYGGAASEDEWRWEYLMAGLPVNEPAVSEVEVGITRVYGAFRRDELIVFDDLDGLRDELMSYSRETDEAGNVLEAIADKSEYHRLDGLRYVVSTLRDAPASGQVRTRPLQHGAPDSTTTTKPTTNVFGHTMKLRRG